MPVGRSPKRRPAAERRPRPYVVISSWPLTCSSLPTRILSAAQDTPGKGAPMQIRRLLFAATLAAAGLNTAAAQAQVQDWPPAVAVRVVVPFAAGGPVDVPARLMNDRLAAQTKSTFII